MANSFKTLMVIMLFIQLPLVSKVRADQSALLNQAKECTKVTARLERLDCFDRIFNTSLPDIAALQEVKPEIWSRGIELEKQRANSESLALISTPNTDNPADIWVTLPAIKVDGEVAPILMLSCVDNISRLDLLLRKGVTQARVNISANTFSPSLWRTDDSGFVLSSARGLLAIDLMKKISSSPMIELHSDITTINGLKFNTQNLSKIFIPLRKSCHW